MKITRTSLATGKEHTREINVTDAQLFAWHNGAYIQDAMPDVSAEDREFLMTGITPEEWDEMWKEDQEADR